MKVRLQDHKEDSDPLMSEMKSGDIAVITDIHTSGYDKFIGLIVQNVTFRAQQYYAILGRNDMFSQSSASCYKVRILGHGDILTISKD